MIKNKLVLVAAVEKSKLNVPKRLKLWVLQCCGAAWAVTDRMPLQIHMHSLRLGRMEESLNVLGMAIPEDVLLYVADKKAAKEVWEAFKIMRLGAERARQARVQTLMIEFEMMKMTEEESIEDFSLKLSGLMTNMRALGETVQENYLVKKLLRAVC
ncbi:hypothetical protein AgCh_033358 [Apium graveolens]